MWLLDLSLSTDFVEPTGDEVAQGTLKPFRLPPWDRFAQTLKALGLNDKSPLPQKPDRRELRPAA
jgi:hypothetical protein